MDGRMGRPRVFLADDAQQISDQLDRLLGSDFEIVGVAHNGAQAVQLAETLRPDILILDISMPVLSGIEVASRLRQRGRNPKIVFLTCHDDSDYMDSAFSQGGLGYVLKYRLTSDLVPALKAALQGDRFVSAVNAVKCP
jgi:DNA-binding NarL/FixJ family response regulator